MIRRLNNSTFINSRKSQYLTNVLDPNTESVSIPDEVLERHVIKEDTVNFTHRTDDSAAFLAMNLNRPSSLLGQFVEGKEITPAVLKPSELVQASQQYSSNFDKCRHISSVVKLYNNTVSTTNFIVAGSINAITTQNKLHNYLKYSDPANIITLPTYSQIAGMTASGTDKTVGVPLATGITTLALPSSFDIPYVELDSRDVGAKMYGGTELTAYNSIAASNNDDIYTVGFLPKEDNWGLRIPLSAQGTPVNVVIEKDVSQGSAADCVIRFIYLNGTVDEKTIPANSGSTVLVEMTNTFDYLICIDLLGNKGGVPMAVKATVTNGNIPGFLYPLTMAVLEGVPSGSNLICTGRKNTELIPSPELAKNVPTKYPYFDPLEMDYVRTIMANRDALRIASVLPTVTYEERLATWMDIATLDQQDAIKAEAFDIMPLLNTVRQIAVPLVSAVFPQAAPIANAIGGLFDSMQVGDGLNNPAYRSYAMEDDGIEDDDDILVEFIDDIKQRRLDINRLIKEYNVVDAEFHGDMEGLDPVLVGPNRRHKAATIFPAVIMHANGNKVIGCMLYAAVKGNACAYLPSTTPAASTATQGRYIHGCDTPYPGETADDITLLPIGAYSKDVIYVMNQAPPVSGTSYQAAVHVLTETRTPGVHVRPITGSIFKSGGKLVPIPNIMYQFKNKYVQKTTGMTLLEAGTQKGVDYWPILDKNSTPDVPIVAMHCPPSSVLSGQHRTLALEQTRSVAMDVLDKRITEMPQIRARTNIESKTQRVARIAALIASETEGTMLSWLPEAMMDVLNDPTKLQQLHAIWTGTAKAKGPSQEQAQLARVEKLYNTLKGQYKDITTDWLIRNNAAGPTTRQAEYYSATGRLPEPGIEPPKQIEVEQPTEAITGVLAPVGKELNTLSKDYLAKIQKRIDNDLTLTDEAIAYLNDFGAQFRRAPSTTEFEAIRKKFARSGKASGGRTSRFQSEDEPSTTAKPVSNKMFAYMEPFTELN